MQMKKLRGCEATLTCHFVTHLQHLKKQQNRKHNKMTTTQETMYRVCRVGSGKNGWYHITHPVIGYCGEVRGYKNALQRVAELEQLNPTPQPTVDLHNVYAQSITTTKRNK